MPLTFSLKPYFVIANKYMKNILMISSNWSKPLKHQARLPVHKCTHIHVHTYI